MNQREASIGTASDRIGFFGKVPSHGDFVASGVSPAFREALDLWLQAGMEMSREVLGPRWKDRFETMPIWRFVVPRGLWGPATHVGVLLPNADRVGRQFPLVVAAQLGDYREDPRQLCFDSTWFTAAEALAETSLTDEFDLTGFPAAIKRLRLPHARDAEDRGQQGSSRFAHSTLWWTISPETRKVQGFSTDGAPTPADFMKLLEIGRPTAADSTGEEGPASVETAVAVVPEAPRKTPVHERSYATHPGTRHAVNGDALLVSRSPSLLVVADGIGDDIRAKEAAKTVVNALSATVAQETLANLVQEVKGKLGRAQGLLQVSMADVDEPRASVVALAGLGEDFAVIWAGDARCYLMRDGTMRALTRDHVEVGLHRRLSRSVGGMRQLVPDVVVDTFQSGDRLLLCSAPLTRVLDERTIAGIVAATPVAEAASTLVQESLIAGTRENVSAIVLGVELAQ
ncbi:type VI secretion system-associated protein TagF [Nitratireductor sp. ZSWI3]|uniref:type VI secretion system-associated protein TagF n=1 Tax=Nitratireductor sp. ZSWI3 TaxID=2966359 RepID=UPI00214FC15C|nr:type VI secretion system-associated protein TagF [Nitratireductor sp. ZSWI3]MCR4266306.1 type VI secretion system-associated protein TagF [Nitratireductor sp. ZSWI3]